MSDTFTAAAPDRQRNVRSAYDHILDRNPDEARLRASRVLAVASQYDCQIAARHFRISAARAGIAAKRESTAVLGAFASIGLAIFLCMMQLPLAEQAARILFVGLALGLFRLGLRTDGRYFTLQLGLQSLLTLVVLANASGPGDHLLLLWDTAVVLLGWSAAGARWLHLAEARAVDRKEIELMLVVEGRPTADAIRAEARRRELATI